MRYRLATVLGAALVMSGMAFCQCPVEIQNFGAANMREWDTHIVNNTQKEVVGGRLLMVHYNHLFEPQFSKSGLEFAKLRVGKKEHYRWDSHSDDILFPYSTYPGWEIVVAKLVFADGTIWTKEEHPNDCAPIANHWLEKNRPKTQSVPVKN
jgi:hypothetical protein